MERESKAVCWMNGELVAREAASVSVFDHGFLYGDGVFEGIRFYNRRAFRLAPHLARLRRSAAAICLTLPYDDAALTTAINETINAFGGANGYLRVVITRGEGPLGIDPHTCATPSVIIIADHIAVVPEEKRNGGIRVITAATRRLSPDGLDARIKSLNYLNHILARMEARNAGADEAILLNTHGHVAEGSVENVFIVSNGTLLTPRATDGALEGITRQAILDLAVTLNVPALETALSPYDLYNADECFLTGTGAELIPVREIDGRPVGGCPGPFFSRLADGFAQLIQQETGGA